MVMNTNPDMENGMANAAGMTNGPAGRISLMEAIEQRHSVRQYQDKPLPANVIAELADAIYACNEAGNLHIQLITNEPEAFAGGLAKYGKFSGVCNYIAMIGRKAPDLEERCGYYGERLVLLAQQMGLNTCWVGMTFLKKKTVYELAGDEKMVILIAIGYGETNGKPRKSKSFADVNRTKGEIPTWYRRGVEAALLAPTAVNQQKFAFTYHPVSKRAVGGSAEFASGEFSDEAGAMSEEAAAEIAATTKTAGTDVTGVVTSALPGVHAEVDGFGFFSKVDLGIVRYHFEVGAETEDFRWV